MRWWIAVFACLAACAASAVRAAYPEKPVRLIMPFPAGGSGDFVARILAQRLSERMGQQFVVENRPGGAGTIGADAVAKARPDGYTVLLGTISSHAINPALYPAMPYDPIADFRPVSQVVFISNVLVVNPGVPARSVRELVSLAKAKPGQLLYATAGYGTSHHLCAEMFKRMAGVDLVHTPFKGNAAALLDLVGGRVQVMFDNISNPLSQIAAGKLRALATTGPSRSAVLPDVPTMVEAGFPGYEVRSWFGLFVPKGTPQPIVERLSVETRQALLDPSVRERLVASGFEPIGSTPAEFGAFVQAELARWAHAVRELGIKIEQ
jgi:tripartite-type tricarboxylate transporter receptor subunit TctC